MFVIELWALLEKMHIMLTVKQLTKNIACLYYKFIK